MCVCVCVCVCVGVCAGVCAGVCMYVCLMDLVCETHTFAALCSVVFITSWAIAAFKGSRRVRAFAFAVTPAVVLLTLVDV